MASPFKSSDHDQSSSNTPADYDPSITNIQEKKKLLHETHLSLEMIKSGRIMTE